MLHREKIGLKRLKVKKADNYGQIFINNNDGYIKVFTVGVSIGYTCCLLQGEKIQKIIIRKK